MRIANKRDFLAGLMFVGFGLAAVLIAPGYGIGTAAAMGAGYFPLVLGGLLILLGLVISVTALGALEEPTPRIFWRPLLAIALAVVLFGLLINKAGLALTTMIVVIVSRLARPGYPWLETLILALLLTAFCVAVFYYALGLQFPLWPRLR